MNEWLAVAPQAQPVHGQTGCLVSLNDMADRAPRKRASAEDDATPTAPTLTASATSATTARHSTSVNPRTRSLALTWSPPHLVPLRLTEETSAFSPSPPGCPSAP